MIFSVDVLNKEIDQALKTMDDSKAPGVDDSIHSFSKGAGT